MKYQKLILYLWLILTAISLTSCLRYSKEEWIREPNSDEVAWPIKKSIYRGLAGDDYLVLRQGPEMWHLSELNFSEDQKSISAKRESVSSEYQKIIEGIKDLKTLGYNDGQRKYVHQVHFFPKTVQYDEKTEIVTILLDDVIKLEIYKHDTKSSKMI